MHPTHSHHHSRLVTNLTCRAPQVELLALHTRVAPTLDSSALGKRYDYATSTARECPQHRCQAMWNATLPCAGREPESLPLALFFWTAGAGDAESCTHDPCSWCAQHKSEARPSSASLCQPSSLGCSKGFLVPCFSPGLVPALVQSCALRMSFATPSPPPPPRQLATPPPRPSRDLCSESTHSLAACATDLDSASSHSIRSSSGLASGKHASVLVVARFRPVSERELKLDSGRSTQPAPLTLDAHSVRAHQSTPVP
jgi:hypothetical protein